MMHAGGASCPVDDTDLLYVLRCLELHISRCHRPGEGLLPPVSISLAHTMTGHLAPACGAWRVENEELPCVQLCLELDGLRWQEHAQGSASAAKHAVPEAMTGSAWHTHFAFENSMPFTER